MEQSKLSDILGKLKRINKTKGFVLFDDISSFSDEYNLSLADFDVLTNELSINGIKVYDNPPKMINGSSYVRPMERKAPKMAGEIEYEIVKNIAVLSTSNKGWTKELNLISWNKRPAKLDIRDWAPEHEKMGKGVTLTDAEADALAAAIMEYRK